MTRSDAPSTKEYSTVCGGKLKAPSLYPSAEYKGKVIYFCTEACRQAFYGDPDRFMAGEIEHPE